MANNALTLAISIDVAGIYHVYPGIQGKIEYFSGFFFWRRVSEIIGAKTQAGHLNPGTAKNPVFHSQTALLCSPINSALDMDGIFFVASNL